MPFENMTEEVGKGIGNRLGHFIEVDKRSWQEDHAKFMRVKVDLPIEKPLRGGRGILRIKNGEELGSRSSMNDYPLSALTVA